ncbi:hypothetical protein [Mammaliicoccus sciuri]|uniref:hypothetical protein n=1 Tax=Mammaliicoccus sciuri TaxID=1296 RepID=UPI001624BAC1|nr:hypothetical protein [Mammaliicoccus sciuri]
MDNSIFKQMAEVYFQMNIDPIFMVPYPISEQEYHKIRLPFFPNEYEVVEDIADEDTTHESTDEADETFRNDEIDEELKELPDNVESDYIDNDFIEETNEEPPK